MALIKREKKTPQAPPVEANGATVAGPRMPVAAPQRRTGLLALALALAVVGALLMWFFQQSSAATPYLTVNRDIPRGGTIERGMLSSVDVVGEPEHLIPASEASRMFGKVATADLGPGSALTDQNTADQLGVSEGRTVVGLALSAGRLPVRELKAGDQVHVVFTPNADLDSTPQTPIPAIVEATGTDQTTGRHLVDLSISTDAAATAATWAAKDAASVVLGASAAAPAVPVQGQEQAAPKQEQPQPEPSASASAAQEGESR